MAIQLNGKTRSFTLNLKDSYGWYDFTVELVYGLFVASYRYAGRVETGKTSFTDPKMGNIHAVEY